MLFFFTKIKNTSFENIKNRNRESSSHKTVFFFFARLPIDVVDMWIHVPTYSVRAADYARHPNDRSNLTWTRNLDVI